MKIAWIGTGVMGLPMANHLSQFHQVTAFNRTKSKLTALSNRIHITNALEVAAKNQEVIFTMLGTPDDVANVYPILFRHVQPDTILIDLTTSSPTLAKALWQEGHRQHISLLDAPVTGGLKGAQEQTLTIMVGGSLVTFQKMKPLLETLGKTILYMGEAGQGQAAKMANQIAIAGQLAGLAEALSFATTKNLNLETILTILSSGAAQSYSVGAYGHKMMQADWQATFYLKHFLKDLRIALAHYPKALPVTSAVEKILSTLVDQYGEKGVQAIIQAYLN